MGTLLGSVFKKDETMTATIFKPKKGPSIATFSDGRKVVGTHKTLMLLLKSNEQDAVSWRQREGLTELARDIGPVTRGDAIKPQ